MLHTLINFLSGSAKLAIWLTRKNLDQGVGSVQPLLVLQGLLKARLKIEHSYYKMVDNLQTFSRMWGIGGVLCSLGGNGELIIHF